jgi:hypothetical protein
MNQILHNSSDVTLIGLAGLWGKKNKFCTTVQLGKFKRKLSLRGIWCCERIILKWISNEEDEGVVWMNVVKAKDWENS